MSLALDQMRTLAFSARYWERYLALLGKPVRAPRGPPRDQAGQSASPTRRDGSCRADGDGRRVETRKGKKTRSAAARLRRPRGSALALRVTRAFVILNLRPAAGARARVAARARRAPAPRRRTFEAVETRAPEEATALAPRPAL